MSDNWINAEEQKPPLKEGWNHSEQVALYYPSTGDRVSGFGIGYWHADPPFSNPMFVDFAHYGRSPSHWCTLPPPPTKLL